MHKEREASRGSSGRSSAKNSKECSSADEMSLVSSYYSRCEQGLRRPASCTYVHSLW